MGASILRPSDRDKERTQGCRSIPQTAHQRRLHNVPVLNLHQALPQQRECQRTHQARKTASARAWQGRNPMHHRQAVRQHGNFLRTEAGIRKSSSAAVGIVLRLTQFQGSKFKVQDSRQKILPFREDLISKQHSFFNSNAPFNPLCFNHFSASRCLKSAKDTNFKANHNIHPTP